VELSDHACAQTVKRNINRDSGKERTVAAAVMGVAAVVMGVAAVVMGVAAVVMGVAAVVMGVAAAVMGVAAVVMGVAAGVLPEAKLQAQTATRFEPVSCVKTVLCYTVHVKKIPVERKVSIENTSSVEIKIFIER
jgi:hypothetical protein